VELENEGVPCDEPFVGSAAVVAAQPEQPLIPPARRLDIAHGDERLGLGETAHRHCHADPVARGVVALDQVPLAAVEHRPPRDAPAAGADPVQERPELIGEDPRHGPGIRGGRAVGDPFADDAWCFEAARFRVDRPPEHSPVEGCRRGDVGRWQLQVDHLPVHRVRPG
jgi:hypothetical protein